MKKTLAVLTLAAAAALHAYAQDADHLWSKTYPVTGRPSLSLDTSDATVDIRPCAACHEVRIRVEIEGKKLSDYRLEENQSGDQVHFLFKERDRAGIHISWHQRVSTRVTIETPAELTLDAHTNDGSVTLTGLNGDLGLTSGDGDATLDHVSGNLRIKHGDGQVHITNSTGTLDAHTSDGNLTVDGIFNVVTLRTSDGQLSLNLREGSKLTQASSLQSSDGSIALHVPRNFAADLNVHTSDGHVDCALPLTMDHYHGSGEEAHELHGKLNGGGTPLTIHTSDGNIKIDQL